MVMTTRTRVRRRRGVSRRWTALIATGAISAGALLAVQPAAADLIADDPWISEISDGIYQFSVPHSVVVDEVGAVPDSFAVEGSFGPGHQSSRLSLGRDGDIWSAKIGPLDPGQYSFHYEAKVDGGGVVEFRNPETPQAVTAQPSLSTLFVEGESAEWLQDVPNGGELTTLDYDSRVAHADRAAQVWTPPNYDANRAEPYPVLYLLQDEGQAYSEWTELGRAAQIFDNLVSNGEIEPMVVVMGDGDTSRVDGEVLRNLIPAVEESFHVSSDSDQRALAGIGRGAAQTLELMVKKSKEFSSFGSFSGHFDGFISNGHAKQINRNADLVRLYVGNTTDASYNDNVALSETLDAAGVEYETDGSNPAYGDIWNTWQEALADFAPRLFQGSDGEMSEGHLALDGEHSLPDAGTTPTPWIDENGIVTFETDEFPEASEVVVWANWGPAGNWLRIPMVRDGDRWRLTVGPLDGGSYYYKFTGDGVDMKDESNPTFVNSEPTWSTFYVAGEGPRAEYTADVAPENRGEVTTMSYDSTADESRSAYVWTPSDYDPARAEAYPVLYLQHGGGQTWSDWIQVGRAAQILDNHYLRGSIDPMVVVMANGNGVDFPTEITEVIVPTAEQHYHVSGDSADRALAGLSMGSGHAFSTLLAHPGEFAYVGLFSTFGSVPDDADVDALNEGTELLSIYSGDVQDFTLQPTLALVESLEENGVDHVFHPLIPGPHSWDVWQKSLIDFLPDLFTAGE